MDRNKNYVPAGEPISRPMENYVKEEIRLFSFSQKTPYKGNTLGVISIMSNEMKQLLLEVTYDDDSEEKYVNKKPIMIRISSCKAMTSLLQTSILKVVFR